MLPRAYNIARTESRVRRGEIRKACPRGRPTGTLQDVTNPPSEPRASTRPVQMATRARHYGVGLRAQTLLALTAAFLVAFSALSIIVVQTAQKSQELERTRRASLIADALVHTSLGPQTDPRDAGRLRTLSALVGHADVIGARLGTQLQVGDHHGRPTARARLRDGSELALWLRARELDSVSPLGRLLRLYSLLTGTLILVVVYVALTRLIVRPVENLTSAVERWKTDLTLHDSAIAISGAAEVVRLGVAFNGMARELRSEKSALEERLHELEQTTTMLRSTQDQLIRSEKLAGVGRLAAGVAHEIGNPLAAILGLVELLQLGSLSRGEEAEFLARIRGETERIHLVIRDLLDYARTRPSDATEGPVEADLERVVEEAVALVAPQKDLRRVTLERRVHGADVRVRGSAHELTQIVINLLLNAADAVAGEGHIMIELSHEAGQVTLAISDSGLGIPPSVRDKLFDPFVTTKAAGQGTGLGLAVCHAIVERLGGSISGENLPRRGARFVVRLPAASA
ncbi:MAG: sensory box sensor histidine kinase [Myxococcaceae bacterium]|nr:sensory box sensor histidine kinase [Myxococcaceae bacterium]